MTDLIPHETDTLIAALKIAEEALTLAQANCGDDPDSYFAEPLAKVRAALAEAEAEA